MNQYCPVHTTRYKQPLLFKLFLRLKSIELRMPKSTNLMIEFVYGTNIVTSKNFHRVEAQALHTNLKEAVEMPIVVSYDIRKDRFSASSVVINIYHQSPNLSKKVASASLGIADILNAKVLIAGEKLKLEKCVDKNAYLNLTAELEYKGPHLDSDSTNQSCLNTSRSRLFNKM